MLGNLPQRELGVVDGAKAMGAPRAPHESDRGGDLPLDLAGICR